MAATTSYGLEELTVTVLDCYSSPLRKDVYKIVICVLLESRFLSDRFCSRDPYVFDVLLSHCEFV